MRRGAPPPSAPPSPASPRARRAGGRSCKFSGASAPLKLPPCCRRVVRGVAVSEFYVALLVVFALPSTIPFPVALSTTYTTPTTQLTGVGRRGTARAPRRHRRGCRKSRAGRPAWVCCSSGACSGSTRGSAQARGARPAAAQTAAAVVHRCSSGRALAQTAAAAPAVLLHERPLLGPFLQ